MTATSKDHLFKSGHKINRKYSDLEVAEVFAMREKWRLGYSIISYLTGGISRSAVRAWLNGQRMQDVTSTAEFREVVCKMMRQMPDKAPPSSKAVAQKHARQALLQAKAARRAALQKKLQDESVMQQEVITPDRELVMQYKGKPTIAYQNRDELAKKKQRGIERRERALERRERVRQRREAAGVPESAPKHIQDRYR